MHTPIASTRQRPAVLDEEHCLWLWRRTIHVSLAFTVSFERACKMSGCCSLDTGPHSNDERPPQYCHPSEVCQIRRAGRQTCQPQGYLEPKICADGFYCPPGGKELILCPKGTFCPSGSYRPLNCTYAAICPAGSVRQIGMLPLFVTLAIDLTLLFVVAAGFGISKRRKSRPKRYTTLDDKGRTPLRRSVYPPDNRRSPAVPVSDLQAPLPVPKTGRPTPMQSRRASGRVDHIDGYADDDNLLHYEEAMDDDPSNSPDMQRFIRSLTQTVETYSIGLSFDFENLSYATRDGKTILQRVTGTMSRGSCWGIVGGSGAGKSTFLNVLMGKTHITRGVIKINGYSKDMKKYKKLIGYVPQVGL